ncbi:hypothetical protein LV779_07180 [Streptomyces thinghirensis]|nr:hypothetical protein [Streptomyces thinghirensis]
MLVGRARRTPRPVMEVAELLLGAGVAGPARPRGPARRPAGRHRTHRPPGQQGQRQHDPDCDTLLMVGKEASTYSEWLPEEDRPGASRSTSTAA